MLEPAGGGGTLEDPAEGGGATVVGASGPGG
jgi:hypothetical protein